MQPLVQASGLLLKAALSAACIYYLYCTLQTKDLPALSALSGGTLSSPLFLAVLALLPLNWILEAKKWQLLARPIEQISLSASLKSVLSGLALGMFAPHTLADFAGRSLHLQNKGRSGTAGALLINNLSQYIPVIAFGLPAYGYYLQHVYPSGFNFLPISFAMALACTLLALLTYFRAGRVFNLLRAFFKNRVTEGLFSAASDYNIPLLWQVLLWGLLRYMVYSLQFVLMLNVCGVQASVLLLSGGVAAVWLVKSSLPGLNLLTDLGLREASALMWFSAFGIAHEPVALAALAIWCINIFVPALAGAVLLFGIKNF